MDRTTRCGWRAAAALLIGSALYACGGGGGGGGSGSSNPPPAPPADPLRVTFSPSNVVFNADVPWGPRPAEATITGSLAGQGTGTLFIVVAVNNPELFSVSNPTISSSTASGSLNVVPVMPNDLGSGSWQGNLDVRVCLNDASCNTGQIQGSPFRVTVRYEVPSMVDADTVTPRVVEASEAGSVILRGQNFTNGATVNFGATAATAVTYVSSTELRANYPSLPAGDHNVSINGGAIAFTGALTAVSPTSFAATFLPFANPPAFAESVVWDAPRRALLFNLQRGMPVPGTVNRYQFTGGAWQPPLEVELDGRLFLRMSHDNSKLLVLRPYETVGPPAQIYELHPETLATQRTTVVDGYAKNFALANDGNLIIATRYPGSGRIPPIVYGVNRRTTLHVEMAHAYEPGSVASRDGSKVLVIGSQIGAYRYESSTGQWFPFATSEAGIDNGVFDSPTSDLTGTRFRVYQGVYDANLNRLGLAPPPHASGAMNADGTRMYTYLHPTTTDNNAYLRTFDLTQPAVGGHFQELGAPIVLPGVPGGEVTLGPKMVVTPDGGTVFLVGSNGIVVQPVAN
jgi:hypothetical protein